MRHLFLCVPLCLATASPAAAQHIIAPQSGQDGVISSYDAAARQAISWHPSITAAVARLSQQEQQVTTAQAAYKPQVSAGLSTGYDNNSASSGWKPRVNMGVNQLLWDFGRTASDVAAEKAGTRASRAEVLAAVDFIIRDTAFSLIEIQRNTDLEAAARQQLDSLRMTGELVEMRYRRGAATRSDMLQALSRVDAAEATLQRFSAELRRWYSNLAYLLGPSQSFPKLAESLTFKPDQSCQLRDIPWNDVPALVRAEANRDRAIALARREQASAYPSISLGANASSDIHRPLEDGRTNYNIGLNVTSTLFSGGSVKSRIQGAAYGLQAADAELASVRNNAERLLAEAREQDSALRTRLTTLNTRYGKMEETRSLYRLQYLEMGTRSLVDLLNAEQEFSQSRFEAIDASYERLRLNVTCLDVSGRLRQAFGVDDMIIEGVSL